MGLPSCAHFGQGRMLKTFPLEPAGWHRGGAGTRQALLLAALPTLSTAVRAQGPGQNLRRGHKAGHLIFQANPQAPLPHLTPPDPNAIRCISLSVAERNTEGKYGGDCGSESLEGGPGEGVIVVLRPSEERRLGLPGPLGNTAQIWSWGRLDLKRKTLLYSGEQD